MQLRRDCGLCYRSRKFLVFHRAKLPKIELSRLQKPFSLQCRLQQHIYATCTYISLLDLEKKYRNRLNPTNNLRVVLIGCVQAGADPANKLRGGAI